MKRGRVFFELVIELENTLYKSWSGNIQKQYVNVQGVYDVIDDICLMSRIAKRSDIFRASNPIKARDCLEVYI